MDQVHAHPLGQEVREHLHDDRVRRTAAPAGSAIALVFDGGRIEARIMRSMDVIHVEQTDSPAYNT